jgi:hypothetical protein
MEDRAFFAQSLSFSLPFGFGCPHCLLFKRPFESGTCKSSRSDDMDRVHEEVIIYKY